MPPLIAFNIICGTCRIWQQFGSNNAISLPNLYLRLQPLILIFIVRNFTSFRQQITSVNDVTANLSRPLHSPPFPSSFVASLYVCLFQLFLEYIGSIFMCWVFVEKTVMYNCVSRKLWHTTDKKPTHFDEPPKVLSQWNGDTEVLRDSSGAQNVKLLREFTSFGYTKLINFEQYS